MADRIVAYCGNVCTECDAYKATQQNDNMLRQAVAEKWTQEYKHDFTPEMINCDGCTAAGLHVGYCNVCNIRTCAAPKGIANCAWCPDYPCAKLEVMFQAAPANKPTLDAIKEGTKK